MKRFMNMILSVVVVMFLAIPAFASTKAMQVELLLAGVTNASGTAPLSGGKVYTYAAGTTTNKTTWTDRNKTTPAANPIVLDSNGKAQIYADGIYKFVIKTSAGTTVYTYDNISFSLQDGPWVDVAESSLTAAVAAIGATETDLLIDGTTSITANTNIPKNIRLKITRKGEIDLGAYSLTSDSPIEWEVGNFTSLNDAITKIGSTVCVLKVNGATTLTGNLTVPSNISMVVSKNGSINQSTYTLAINGPFEAGLSQVFMGTGNVSGLKEASAEWWGTGTSAINSAIYSVKDNTGKVRISSDYNVGTTTITLYPSVTIEGVGGYNPTITYTGTGNLFEFTGTTEAQNLNVKIANLELVSSNAGSGVAIQVMNFFNLEIEKISIYNFAKAVKASWGIGLFVRNCNITTNTRGVEVGGGTNPPGVRGGSSSTSPFMDTVVLDGNNFSQNQIDINDMGSTNSLGGISITNNSFFENYAAPVTSKTTFIRLAGRRGININSNWFELGYAGRVGVLFSAYDYDATLRGQNDGAKIHSNHFLVQGAAASRGVQVDRCFGVEISTNAFEWQNASGGYAIDIQDTTSPAVIGYNSYITRNGGGYTGYVNQATDYSLFLDPSTLARALTSPKFVILPNGLILQYATISLATGATNSWTYPKAFPGAVVYASCVPLWAGNNLYTSLESLSTSAAVFRNSDNAGHAITGVCVAIGY